VIYYMSWLIVKDCHVDRLNRAPTGTFRLPWLRFFSVLFFLRRRTNARIKHTEKTAPFDKTVVSRRYSGLYLTRDRLRTPSFFYVISRHWY